MSNEEWKDIEEYEGLYQVSNYGRVKSLNGYHRKERILTLRNNLYGNFIKSWKGSKYAMVELGIWNTNIVKCCKGERKTTGGYIWKYGDKGGGVNNG